MYTSIYGGMAKEVRIDNPLHHHHIVVFTGCSNTASYGYVVDLACNSIQQMLICKELNLCTLYATRFRYIRCYYVCMHMYVQIIRLICSHINFNAYPYYPYYIVWRNRFHHLIKQSHLTLWCIFGHIDGYIMISHLCSWDLHYRVKGDCFLNYYLQTCVIRICIL